MTCKHPCEEVKDLQTQVVQDQNPKSGKSPTRTRLQSVREDIKGGRVGQSFR